MTQWIKVIDDKPDDRVQSLGLIWWKEGTNSSKLPSDFHKHTISCTCVHIHNSIKSVIYILKNIHFRAGEMAQRLRALFLKS